MTLYWVRIISTSSINSLAILALPLKVSGASQWYLCGICASPVWWLILGRWKMWEDVGRVVVDWEWIVGKEVNEVEAVIEVGIVVDVL